MKHLLVLTIVLLRLSGTDNVYTHRIYDDFSKYPAFNEQWMIYDYWQHADNPHIRLEAKYDLGNVRIRDKMLQLQQLGYTDEDDKRGHHVSMAGLQTKRQDIMHGTFRTVFKVEGANGGSCAAWFWHRDDNSELDIEAITKGDSRVNNTINYTTHPSLTADGFPIFNATRSVPLSEENNTNIEVFHEHRFDSDRAGGAHYYIDGHLMHTDGRLVRKLGGNLQLKLWADGNKWWSGHPSSTTVTMYVKSIIAYFNTTGVMDGTDQGWFDICEKAGGPSNGTVCEAYATVDKDDDLPLAASAQPISATNAAASGVPTESSACVFFRIDGTCETTSQAARHVPFSWLRGLKYLKAKFQKLSSRDEPFYTIPFGSPVEDDDDEEHTNTTKSQGARVRPPQWFNTLYARNSTRLAYKIKQNPIVRNLEAVMLDSETRATDVNHCEQDNNEHCSVGQVLDFGRWWTCLRKKSDWCFLFAESYLLLTNGLIQVISVPVIFAWVFYMTEG